MIIMGAGTNHWFHADTIYRAILALVTLTGCQGVNGGGWAHYVGQEKVRPFTGWAQLAFGLDWVAAAAADARHRRSGTWHTDQWRYDGFGADELATPARARPVRRAAVRRHHRAGRAAGLDCRRTRRSTATRSTWPTRRRRPGIDAGRLRRRRAQGRAGSSSPCADPDAPENWPRVLTVWRANLLGSSGKGNEYFLRHLLGADAAIRAEETPPRAAPARGDVARRGARGQARPARVARLPDDQHGPVLGLAAAGGDLVREVRPLDHRHAPVRARVQRRIAPPWETRSDYDTFVAHRRGLQPRWPRATWASAATSSRRRCSTTRPARPPSPAARCCDWRRGECEPIPGETMPASSSSSATTARSRR